MAPRLYCAQKKCVIYVKKLDASLYYLAARILNPQCCTAFLKDENEDITAEEEKKLYVVWKLWERFCDNTLFSDMLYESESVCKPALQSEEYLSVFYKARRKHILRHICPQSQDEFDNYASENLIMLESMIAIQWWSHPIQRGRYP